MTFHSQKRAATGSDKGRPENRRRSFLVRLTWWAAAGISAVLVYPLFRFSGFQVKPKPRHVKVDAPLPASGFHAEREFILFADHNGARAISRTCTHLGCRVNYLEDKQIIECPCHQSRFTLEGTLISGPAKKDLAAFFVETRTDAAGSITGYVVTL